MISALSLDEFCQVEFSNGTFAAVADLPKDKGGNGQGFGAHELLEAALAVCITMTVQMAARKHGFPLEKARAEVRIDRSQPPAIAIVYNVHLVGPLTPEQREHLMSAAASCPVSRTLTSSLTIRTENW